MASMRELAMELLSRSGSGPVLQPTNVYGQDPDLPIGYGEGEISPLDAAAMSTMFVPGVGDVTGLAADVDMYMRDPESRNIPNYLLTAAGALPFLPAASQVRKGIKAYHGSPYSFDRFSTEQIGTGEGAQAYGQGLYFAESEDVARGYRKNLSRDRLAQIAKDDQSYDTLVGLGLDESPDLGDFSTMLSDADGDMARAIQDSMTPRYPNDLLPAFAQSMADAMKSGRLPASIELPTLNKGSMYEVNIDVEPDELLDWDQLIDEQPSKVLDKLKKSDWWEYAEEGIYDRAGARGDNPTGADLIRWLEEDGGEYAAEALKDLGVKGVRYADAFTRHKTPDKRSMNYVIFDDRLITIAKKYGIAIPAAAAMLARMTGEDTSQSYQEET
jgi:hypothetical protein